MTNFLRKTSPELSLEERSNSALALAAAATSVIEDIGNDLAQAASEHAAIAKRADDEINRLAAIRTQARVDEVEALAIAQKVRALIA